MNDPYIQRLVSKDVACASCGKMTHHKCSGCNHAYYCCRTCQVAEWKSHKSVCDKMKQVHKHMRTFRHQLNTHMKTLRNRKGDVGLLFDSVDKFIECVNGTGDIFEPYISVVDGETFTLNRVVTLIINDIGHKSEHIIHHRTNILYRCSVDDKKDIAVLHKVLKIHDMKVDLEHPMCRSYRLNDECVLDIMIESHIE